MVISMQNDLKKSRHQFIAKERGQTNKSISRSAPNIDTPRKGIDKRWFIIAALSVVLIISLATRQILRPDSSGTGSAAVKPYTESVVGLWGCSGGTDMLFSEGSTYLWENITEASIAERGGYTQSGNHLQTTAVSRTVAGEFADFDPSPIDFYLYLDGYGVSFVSPSARLIRSCVRINYE